jgi:hypothetical protein
MDQVISDEILSQINFDEKEQGDKDLMQEDIQQPKKRTKVPILQKRIISSSGDAEMNEIVVTPSRFFIKKKDKRDRKLQKLQSLSSSGKIRLVCLSSRTITMQMPRGLAIESFSVMRTTDKADVSSHWQTTHVSVDKELLKFQTPKLDLIKLKDAKLAVHRQACFTFTFCSEQHTTHFCDVVFVGKTLYNQNMH